ncbi:MAG: TonB-dependent receptor [Pseudomonadota bacterium]
MKVLLNSVSLAAVLAITANGAHAQEATAGRDAIIVTGQKIDRSLQDTFDSVSVTTIEEIEENNFVDIYDIINQTANVTGSSGDRGFAIRGLRNVGALSGDQTSNTSAFYIDGVFIPTAIFSSSAINLWDIQSVEIFRGPQSTIQGRNALIGAISMRSVDPGNEFAARGQLSYAQYDTFRGSLAATLPIAEDQISLRVSGDYSESRGFNTNSVLNTDDGDRSDTLNLRAKFLITPEALPGFTARIGATYLESSQGENRIETIDWPNRRESVQNVEDREDNEATILSAELDYDITDNLSVTSMTSYIDSNGELLFDTDNLAIGTDMPGSTIREDEVFTQELRFNYSSDRFEAVFGGYFFSSESVFDNGSFSLVGTDFAFPDAGTLAGLLFMTPTPNLMQIGEAQGIRDVIVATYPFFEIGLTSDRVNEIKNYAAFGEVTYNATDKLSLTLGLRYDIEDIDQNSAASQLPLPVEPLPATSLLNVTVNNVVATVSSTFTNSFDLNADNDFEAFLPKAVVAYDWTENFSTSFSYQRAYRAGGLSVNNFRAALAEDTDMDGTITQDELAAQGIVNAFDPEFTNNFEIGLRSQWLDNRLTVNANLFHIRYNDQQINSQLSSNPLDTLTDNVGASELTGFEVEAFADPMDNFQLYANLGYTETEFTEDSSLSAENLAGLEFSFAPKWTAGFGGRYTLNNGLFANIRTRYVGESFASITNEPNEINDSHFIVDTIFGYQQDNFGVEFFVNNLFDEEYLTRNFGTPGNGSINVAGAPRVIGGRVTFNY